MTIASLFRSVAATAAAGLMIGALACGEKTPVNPTPVAQPVTPVTPTPPPAPAPTPPPPPNNAPRITGLRSNVDHIEMEREIELTATVADDETAPGQLTYEWSAPAGSFTGTGAIVRWRAPKEDKTPVFYTLTLKVIERYTGPNGPTQHEVTATTRITVNNSRKEMSDLAGGFLADFAFSPNSPVYCVRNFHDSCRGKRDEIQDITENRAKYTILSSQRNEPDVQITGSTALVTIRTSFVSRIKATGVIEAAVGDALVSGIYVGDRWYLCESRWRPVNAAAVGFMGSE